MAKTRVVAAVIQREDKFFVCLRPESKRHGGMWEFPGGKLASGESLAEAAERELSEELSLKLDSAGEVIYSATDPGSDFIIEFIPVAVTGDFVLHEHEAVRWASLEELEQMKLAPTDTVFVHHLKDEDNR